MYSVCFDILFDHMKVSKHLKSVRHIVCQFLVHMSFALLSPLPSLDVWEW